MSGRVVSDIYTVAYVTPTSKCSCLSTIFKIKAILAK